MAAEPIDEEIAGMDIAVEAVDAHAYELARMRHSCAHLMAEAVQEVFPDARFGIGPPSSTASTTTSTCPVR
jgi:threonyl-tRNA synthetase